jgi:hypothetical protein
LFTYHGDDVLPYQLFILSHVPETCHPSEYRTLLPALRNENNQQLWAQQRWRDKDYLENHDLVQQLGISAKFTISTVKQALLKLWQESDTIGQLRITSRDSMDLYANLLEQPKSKILGKESCVPMYPVTAEQIVHWYVQRAKDIEEKSGLVSTFKCENNICRLRML